jgi:hypothetical protein
MINSAALPRLGFEFDAFLFAPVGDDKNGMPLSVLSVLARLDVDPWQEAADLARLPGRTAIERLTSLIEALPGRPLSPPAPETTAARIIALLPSRGSSIVPSRGEISGDVPATNLQAIVHIVSFNLIMVAFILGAQWIVASSRVAATQAAETPATTSQTNPPLTPNPGPGIERAAGSERIDSDLERTL